MKKNILSLIIILFVWIFFSQCNTEMDVMIAELTAQGSYDSTTDETSVKIKVAIQNNTIILARITNWQFICWDDDDILLQIHRQNYRQIFCNAIYCDTIALTELNQIVGLETLEPKIGDVFEGKTPKNIYVWLEILDENDNVLYLESWGDFEFTRK